MTLALGQLFVRQMCRPRVVHRLPGRLRVHVPVLQRLPADDEVFLDRLVDVLTRCPGVEGVQGNRTSANLLIRYDPDSIEEKVLLHWLHNLADSAMRVAPGLVGRPASAWRQAAERLLNAFEGTLHGTVNGGRAAQARCPANGDDRQADEPSG